MPNFLDDYEPVEDRLREFWADHPDGRIETEIVQLLPDGFIVKASVWREDIGDVLGKTELYRPSATGFARDTEATLPPNMRASVLEVCETSAIGRCLANLGYAPKGRRPSREEMQKSDAALTRAQPASDSSGEGDSAGQGQAGPSPSATTDEPRRSSPEHHFPVDPAACDHRTAAGRWVKWVPAVRGDGFGEQGWVCPKCGTPKLVAMESTTADLGPAT